MEDDISRMLFAYDATLQNICKALFPLNMSEMILLPIYYEAPTSQMLSQKVKSIEAFNVVLVPLKKFDDG